MDGKQLQSQYKDHLSDFQNWDQRAHAQEYILYPKNMGYHLCIDETALSKGDLYTILINRDKRGRKGSIIAVIQVAVQNSFYKRDFFGTGYMDFTVLEICLHKATA